MLYLMPKPSQQTVSCVLGSGEPNLVIAECSAVSHVRVMRYEEVCWCSLARRSAIYAGFDHSIP
jgi:hypothetical protein